jgi:hypothetical protein
LTNDGSVLGSKGYDLSAGRKGDISVRLDKTAMKRLRKFKHHSVRARELVSVKGGATMEKQIELVATD